MHRTVTSHTVYSGWKPVSCKVVAHAPLYDWLTILRHGRMQDGRSEWSLRMRGDHAGAAIAYLLQATSTVGLCGRVG